MVKRTAVMSAVGTLYGALDRLAGEKLIVVDRERRRPVRRGS